MKRIIQIVMAVVLAMSCFCGCGTMQNDERLSIVCTIFPVYDWMRELTDGCEGVELTLIADNGVDMHSYQPTTDDIVTIATCDVFVYVGGESDEWVEEVLSQAVNEDMIVVNLLDALGDRAMESAANAHEHDHEEHDHECVYDEHIWLSLINARELCGHLSEVLCAVDEADADRYTVNCAAYVEAIDALDSQYREAADIGMVNTLLFADRFPFRYLTADYGIEYFAAFDGCSAETEASFDTIAALSAAVDENGLNCVLMIEGSDDSLARTIIAGSKTGGQTVLTVDSMQSVTASDIESGVTYLSVMEDNLEVLRQALGCQ